MEVDIFLSRHNVHLLETWKKSNSFRSIQGVSFYFSNKDVSNKTCFPDNIVLIGCQFIIS